MTVDDLQTGLVILSLVSSAFLILERVKKLPREMRSQDTNTSRIEQEIRANQIKEIADMQSRLEQVELKLTVLRAEVTKQTDRADQYQRQAETVAAENVKLIQEVTSIRSLLGRILDWSRKWEPQLKAAGIDPMPTE